MTTLFESIIAFAKKSGNKQFLDENMPDEICSCVSSTDTSVAPSLKHKNLLFQLEHESANLAVCQRCKKYFLVYDVECRDDTFIYSLPITSSLVHILNSTKDLDTMNKLVRSNILGKRVFCKSPWDAKWQNEITFLPESRPF